MSLNLYSTSPVWSTSCLPAARNLLRPAGDETALRMSVQMLQPRSARPFAGATAGDTSGADVEAPHAAAAAGSEVAGATTSAQMHRQPAKTQTTRVQVTGDFLQCF